VKIIYLSGIMFLMLFLLPGKAFCQNKIYRSDGTVMNIDILSFDGKTIKYRLPDDVSGKMYYLSSSVIDSLRDDNLGIVTFPKPAVPVNKVKRNYIGTDLFNTCLRNLNLSFERLSASGNTSFSMEFLINLNTENFYGVYDYWRFTENIYLYYDPFYFFTKAGFYYYPFNYSLNKTGAVRIFTGTSLLLGRYKKEDYTDYYDPIIRKPFAAVISWNIGTKIYLGDGFLIKADFEMSVIPFLVFNSPEVGIVIGF
jgi:hypothetical protein